MVLAPSVAGLFKWRQFEPEMILLAVGWYSRFSLSYRDVEELLAERGLRADHVTVWRWVQRYAPEIQRRLRPRLRPTNDSWRVDETYIRLKGKWVYLYRAVDSTGATIDFLLSAKRDAAAAERFLAKALGGANHPAPRVINTDKHSCPEDLGEADVHLLEMIRLSASGPSWLMFDLKQLRGQYGTIGRLKPNVVVPGSSRIQTRQNRFQRVPSIGIRELMSSAAETMEIVFTITISMPEIQ